MLTKLLKYDLKNLFKTLLPIYLITLVITILTIIFNNLSDLSNLFSTLNALVVFAYVIILMILLIGTFFLNIRDFYLDFTSERAYLVNTLPVKKSTILTSKVLTSLITAISSTVIFMISICILIIGNGEWTSFTNDLYTLFTYFTSDAWLMLILCIILIIVAYLSQISLCYLSIAIGQLKNTNKLAFSFIAYIVLYIIYEIYFALTLSSIFIISPDFVKQLDATFTPLASINLLFIILIILILIIIAIIMPITNYILNRKLNLE